MNNLYYKTNLKKIYCSIRLERQAFYFSVEQLIFSAAFGVDPILKVVRIHKYIDTVQYDNSYMLYVVLSVSTYHTCT